MGKSLIDNFDFKLFGQSNDSSIPKFRGYVSSIDPTTAGTGVLIGGSQNTYKSLLGTVKNRAGLKRRGEADPTAAGVVTSFEWETSLGATRVLRASNGKLQVEFDNAGTIEEVDLMTGLTEAEMAFSYSPWYDEDAGKDDLIFVNGQQEINMWTGGLGKVASATVNTIKLASTTNVQELGFSPTGTLIINGVEYVYTGAGELENQIFTASATNATPALSSTTWHAQLVTTSGAATGILRVTARVNSLAVSATASVFNCFICEDNAGVPGTIIGTAKATIPGAHSAGDFNLEFDFSGVAATPGTNYFVVLSQVSGGSFDAYIGNTPTAGTLISTNTGVSWSTEDSYLFCTVYENTVAGDTFTGVSPDPSALPVNTVVAQAVVVSTKTASGNLFSDVFGQFFTNDWIATIGNQLYIGCYTSRLVFESAESSYLSYSIPVLRSPGDANVYTLDTNSRGATSKSGQKGNAVLFGSQGDSYSIVNSVETVQISTTKFASVENQTIEKQTSSDLSSPISQDFIASVGDTILFVDEGNQLREFGTLRNLATPVYPILSLDVYTELASADLTGGALRAVAEQSGESVYITSPVNGFLYIYQIRDDIDRLGNLGAERLWQPPFIVNASRVAVIDAVTYVYSNVNPQMYQLWDTGQFYDDSPSDDHLPYECHAIFAYMSLKDRAQQLSYNRTYFEGYMTEGTDLYCNMYFDYQGASGLQTVTINQPLNPGRKVAKFFGAAGSAPSLGTVSLGLIPLGQGVGNPDFENPAKFRAMRSSQPVNCFEFALDVFSFEVDSEWEMLCLGSNFEEVNVRPTGIMA
jgi:hypothetical protein